MLMPAKATATPAISHAEWRMPTTAHNQMMATPIYTPP